MRCPQDCPPQQCFSAQDVAKSVVCLLCRSWYRTCCCQSCSFIFVAVQLMLLHALLPMSPLTCIGCCAAVGIAHTVVTAASNNAYCLLHACFFSNCCSLRLMMQCQTSGPALPVPPNVTLKPEPSTWHMLHCDLYVHSVKSQCKHGSSLNRGDSELCRDS